MGAAVSCGSSSGPYPASLPPSVSLPDGVSILQPDDKDAVAKAVTLCARSFSGTDAAPGPTEFDWLLFDKNQQKITDAQQRAHRMSPVMSWALHEAFVMKDRGLVFVVRGEGDVIAGVLMLYLYSTKWAADSGMMQMRVMMASGASKWDAAQNEMMSSTRMVAFDKAHNGMKKQYCVGDNSRIAYVQVLAVDPEFQNRGFGKKLLSVACAVGDGLGLPLYLETDAGKNGVFYEKFGFAELGSCPLEVKDGPKFEGKFMTMRRAVGAAGQASPAESAANDE